MNRSFWFSFGLRSRIKNISKIKQSDLFEHFLRTLEFFTISHGFHVVLLHGCGLPIIYVPPGTLWCRCRLVKPTWSASHRSHWKIYTTFCWLIIGGLSSLALSSVLIFWLVKTRCQCFKFGIYLSAKITLRSKRRSYFSVIACFYKQKEI